MKDELVFADDESLKNAKSYTHTSWDDLPTPKCVMCGEPCIRIEGWNLWQCQSGCLDHVGNSLTYTDYRDKRFGIGDFIYAH